MERDVRGQAGKQRRPKRDEVKHVQQARVADGEGRQKPTARGKEQQVGEKKEARPNVSKRKMQKKPAKPRGTVPRAGAKRRSSSKAPGAAKTRGSK